MIHILIKKLHTNFTSPLYIHNIIRKVRKIATEFSMDNEKQKVKPMVLNVSTITTVNELAMSQIVFCKYSNDRSCKMGDTNYFLRSN